MTNLAITHVTLYKHGIGFFVRRATVSGEEVTIAFASEAMNDVLKSLTAIDWGGGQVLGVDYATPQDREDRLAGCSIRLGEKRSLRDLLSGLRGRRVRLTLDQGDRVSGTLLGVDELADDHPPSSYPVSVLLDGTDQVQVLDLGRVQGVEILDPEAIGDLRFFLETSRDQDEYRQVAIRMTPGEHDLAVSYIAPAPVWRVSYRLAIDTDAQKGPRALLLGWGIFDNRLEEDLEQVALSLVAGMPISFIYDLATPFTPERPIVEEERRVAPAPLEFAQAAAQDLAPPAPMPKMRAGAPAPAAAGMLMDALAEAAPVDVVGEEMGELFRYDIATPVSVGRGQSAMVPIVSTTLDARKDLLYNGRKFPAHPVATLRLENTSGLTLERGPVTVMEGSDYLGEAILPFTINGGEMAVPYAVELGVKVREQSGYSRELHRLYVKEAFMQFEEWDLRWREVQFNDATGEPTEVLVEHPRSAHYELYDTPEPAERTDDHFRFAVQVPAHGETTLRVQERRLIIRREELQRQSHANLRDYLRRGLMERAVHDQVAALLEMWEKIADGEQDLARIEEDRQRVYEAQRQIQGNMQALGKTGKEGDLRTQYVARLEATEAELAALSEREVAVRREIERLAQEAAQQMAALGGAGQSDAPAKGGRARGGNG